MGNFYFIIRLTRTKMRYIHILPGSRPNFFPAFFEVADIRLTVLFVLNLITLIDLLVGVHCLHGINRTGYSICKWVSFFSNYLNLAAVDFHKFFAYHILLSLITWCYDCIWHLCQFDRMWLYIIPNELLLHGTGAWLLTMMNIDLIYYYVVYSI